MNTNITLDTGILWFEDGSHIPCPEDITRHLAHRQALEQKTKEEQRTQALARLQDTIREWMGDYPVAGGQDSTAMEAARAAMRVWETHNQGYPQKTVYRKLKPGETIRGTDEYLMHISCEWVPVQQGMPELQDLRHTDQFATLFIRRRVT